MKTIVYIIFVILCLWFLAISSKAQMSMPLGNNKDVAFYRMRMVVHKVDSVQSICIQEALVKWGIVNDTIIFAFEQESLKFYPIKKKYKWRKKDEKQIVQKYIEDNSKQGDRMYIAQDDLDRKYLIRFFVSNGILIFITNIDDGTPSYTLCMTRDCNLCK